MLPNFMSYKQCTHHAANIKVYHFKFVIFFKSKKKMVINIIISVGVK